MFTSFLLWRGLSGSAGKSWSAKNWVWLLRKLRSIFAFECLVANEVRTRRPVKAVSRRRRGPKARLYRTSRTDHHQPPGVDGSPPRWFFSAIFLRFHAAAHIFHW